MVEHVHVRSVVVRGVKFGRLVHARTVFLVGEHIDEFLSACRVVPRLRPVRILELHRVQHAVIIVDAPLEDPF